MAKAMTLGRIAAVLAGLVAAQLVLSYQIKHVRPTLGILPDVVQSDVVDAAAFGDRQFLFRYLALTIQNAGDNGGRVTPLTNYDYEAVVAWLDLLDDLDVRSHWPVAMANGYFGQTPKTDDVAPIVRYMQRHTAEDSQTKWPWLIRGIYLARHRLEDDWAALDVSFQLAAYDFPDMNPISYQMPALVLDDLGQPHRAATEMETVLTLHGAAFRAQEQRWMEGFIKAMEDEAVDGGQ